MYRIHLFVLSITAGVQSIVIKGRGYSTQESTFSYPNEVLNLTQMYNDIGDIFNNFNETAKKENDLSDTPDTHLNISQLITKYGYKFEEHHVVTEDGHILGIHRLLAKNDTQNGKVVFLMHGILDSSDSWILQGPNEALGYILADSGFDVWMGNARGNKYSVNHTSLHTNSSDFWEFTWEEIGLYDLPVMIDYVLNTTKQKHLYYIGHSQGTTIFFVLTSMKPEYNDKIKLMFALAPVAWMTNVKSSIVRFFSSAQDFLSFLLSGFNQYTGFSEFLNKWSPVLCLFTTSCNNIMTTVFGGELKNINSSLIPVIFGHMPTGSSVSQFVHYGQLIQSETFSRFDHGRESNIKLYGRETPPEYDLANIKVPIYLFYADHDLFTDPKDVLNLQRNLPNVKGAYLIEDFGHLEFIYSMKAKDLIYDNITEIIENNEDETFHCIF